MPSSSQKNKKGSQSQLVDMDNDSQGSPGNKLNKNELERKVNEMIRYILFSDKKKVGIKRQDLMKNVMKEHSKVFSGVLKEVKSRLEDVFGLELVEMCTGDGKSRGFILINKIEKLFEDEVSTLLDTEEDSVKMGLLLLVSSIVFMNEGALTEISLWHFLGKFGVLKDSEHDVFGSAEKLISQEFVKQNYLERQKVQGAEGPTWQYNLGPRLSQELSKRKILEFVSEVYGVGSIKDWKTHYQYVLDSEQVGMDLS